MRWLDRSIGSNMPVIDTGYLERLGEHLGPEVMRELMADGLIEIADRMADLEGMARRGDTGAIAAAGHDVVAVAGHLGLGALSAAAVEMNRAARKGAAPPQELIAPVTAAGVQALDVMSRYIEARSLP